MTKKKTYPPGSAAARMAGVGASPGTVDAVAALANIKARRDALAMSAGPGLRAANRAVVAAEFAVQAAVASDPMVTTVTGRRMIAAAATDRNTVVVTTAVDAIHVADGWGS